MELNVNKYCLICKDTEAELSRVAAEEYLCPTCFAAYSYAKAAPEQVQKTKKTSTAQPRRLRKQAQPRRLRKQAQPTKQMSFKSEAQRQKFLQLLAEGKISKQTFESWAKKTKESTSSRLPERIKAKKIRVKEV